MARGDRIRDWASDLEVTPAERMAATKSAYSLHPTEIVACRAELRRAGRLIRWFMARGIDDRERRRAWPPMGFGPLREGEPPREGAEWLLWFCQMIYANASWVPAGDARIAGEIAHNLVEQAKEGSPDA